MKEKFRSILEEYSNDSKKMIGLTKYKIRGYWKKFNKDLEVPEKRKKYFLIASSFVLLVLLANLYTSYGFYNDYATFPIVQAKVGNMFLKDYDYSLLIYLENGSKQGSEKSYHLTNSIPTFGYKYNGFSCKNGSKLKYDEDLLTTSVSIKERDVCSIYFDLENKVDLTVNIMLEDMVDSDTYSLSSRIPYQGYVYSHYECSNGGEVSYDSKLHRVSLLSEGKDYCNIYFVKEKIDIEMKLYVEKDANSNEYIERLEIPSNISYHLNASKSFCVNKDNERIKNSISYVDGYIETISSEITACNVYLDRDE